MERGLCCRAFPISIPYADLITGYDAWRSGSESFVGIDGVERGIPTDVHLVAAMLRPLGLFSKHPIRGDVYDNAKMLFSCVHLEAGRCGVYERRPNVCRIYPSTACEYPECACWSGGQCREPWRVSAEMFD